MCGLSSINYKLTPTRNYIYKTAERMTEKSYYNSNVNLPINPNKATTLLVYQALITN